MSHFERSVSLMGASGFIGSHYAKTYPDQVYCEPRESVRPVCADVLCLRSTVSNYNVLKPETLKLDVETNLLHLLDILPNVRGVFNWTGTWFSYGSGPNDYSSTEGFISIVKENFPCNPNGLYSATKLCAEHIIRSYTQTSAAGLVLGPTNYRILRLSNVIGNDPRAGKTKNALEMLLAKVINNEAVEVYEGDNYRDILHVSDVCRAIKLCLDKAPLDCIVNIGRGQSHRMIDIVDYAISKTGSKSAIKRVPVPRFHQIVQVPDFFMDVNKLRALGFVPTYSLGQSIDMVIEGMGKAKNQAV